MNAAPHTLDDRRAAAIAAALVIAVLVVIGFGSGIAAIVNRDAALPMKPFTVSPGLATPIQQASAVDVSSAGGSSAGGGHHGASSSGATMASANGGMSSSMGGLPSTSVAPCSGQFFTSAMLEPFFVHFDKAHLETSPGQQAQDALNVNQYVKTHTVLVEAMWTPLVNLTLAAPNGVNPFGTHFFKAHLETSPGQQVNDATNVDQYTKTHTVLVENMLNPTTNGMTDAGC